MANIIHFYTPYLSITKSKREFRPPERFWKAFFLPELALVDLRFISVG